MGPFSKTPMKLTEAKHQTSFYLCHNLASWLGLDCRKPYDKRHAEDIPPEFNSFGPFVVTIIDIDHIQTISSHDDFILALLHAEKTKEGTRATVHDKDQTIIAEVFISQ